MIGRKHDNRRSVLEPPELIAFAHDGIAGEGGRPPASGIEHDIEKMQPDTRNQNRRDRHHGQDLACLQAGPDNRTLVFAKKFLNPFQRDRIDVPGIAADEIDLLDPTIVRCVKPDVDEAERTVASKTKSRLRMSFLPNRNLVLVVDDDRGILRGMKRLLRQHGYDTLRFRHPP